MEFRVLGPLEVRAGDESLLLGAPAERHLLAVLLVFANETVSTDRLVDELWGDDSPPTARNMVQRYVSRLRRALRDLSGERLVTETHGYRLWVEAGELDATRFDQLVAKGREAADPGSACACLGEALGLWRGPFLDGVEAGPAVAAERVRWEEARLVVVEERCEADLALGRHSDLVAELQELTQRYPFRERLWAQLMLALHRCGRQAEALRAYASYRRRIADEVGLEPSTELAHLEEQILLGDPDLAAPGTFAGLPTGEVTFLFTDIEGSAALWEEHPAGMPEALARHDDVLHQAVEGNCGVVFKSVGDGICAVFSCAADAVRAALDAQRHLSAQSWDTGSLDVRMALHTGEALLRDGDYLGQPLNRTARLLATAHGGQIVVTKATSNLVQDRLPADARLTDLGEHRLKDLSQPERVFQLDHPSLRSDFPLLRSLGAFRHNLPHRLTEFIGRRHEIDTVADLVRDHRLVTLIGPGGIGKTSLAIRTTAEMIDHFSDGVWLVELAGIPEGDLIGGAVAGLLGIKERPGEDPTETLAQHLDGTETLLVLDNCEHVIDSAAKFGSAFLGAADGVKILATSREPLAVLGEATMLVPSLELPPATDLASSELEATEAVALFLDRARLLVPGFTLDGDNAAAVAEICCRLDGIPLALELAAARLNTLTARQIADRLDDRLRLLSKGYRSAPSRHQTLQALLDWSHNLLAEPEQVLLRRIAVFGGSFTLEAAEHVCGYDPLDPALIADLLDRLTDTSMVVPPRPPSSRYHTLETVREHARQHLEAAGETNPTMRRLGEYLNDAAPGSWADLHLPDAAAWYRWIEEEQDNYRAALTWAIAAKSKDHAARTAIEFQEYLSHAGRTKEAQAWVDAALDVLDDEPTQVRLRLLGIAASAFMEDSTRIGATRGLVEQLRGGAEVLRDEAAAGMADWFEAVLVQRSGDLATATTLHAAAERRLRAVDDPRCFNALGSQIVCRLFMGHYEAAKSLVDRFEATTGEASWSAATTVGFRAWIALLRGDFEEAQLRLDDLEALAGRAGSPEFSFLLTELQCQTALRHGTLSTARELASKCRLLADELGQTDPRYAALRLQALTELDAAGPRSAAPHARDLLECAESAQDAIAQAEAAAITGDVALAAGDPAQATLLHAAADAANSRSQRVLSRWSQARHDQAMLELREAIGAAGFEQIRTEGYALSLDQTVHRARCYINDLLERP